MNSLENEVEFNNRYLTPQEHALIGSTVESQYHQKFYTPIAIQSGEPVDRVARARLNKRIFMTMSIYYHRTDSSTEIDYKLIPVILAPLNEHGETMHDPRALDETLKINDSNRIRLRHTVNH